MEDFEEDDFSDLYADVEVQASSAISAMHGLTKMRSAAGEMFGNPVHGGGGMEVEKCGGSLTKLPMENGDSCRDGKGGHEIEVDQNKNGGVNGNENSGDSNVVVEKKRVDERAIQVYQSSEDEDADLDDEIEPCFSSGSEDDGPKFGRNDGGKNASESVSGHVHDHLSLDLYKHENVQISDSVEDNTQEISDYGSDGTAETIKTSNDTNRRNANRRNTSSMFNKVPLSVKHESSLSGQSQHSPGSSQFHSSSTALSDDDIKNSHNHPSSHGAKSRTVDRRYCDRERGPRSKHKLNNRDDSNANDLKGRHEMQPYRINHGKKGVMHDSNSNEKDMRFCNRSESFLNYSGGFFPDHHMRKQYWNLHPSFGYGACWFNGHNPNERQNFHASQMDYEALQDPCYDNQRRHAVQVNFKESRKLFPKYPSYTANKGDGLHVRRRRKGDDDLSPPRDYNYEYRSSMLTSERDRDHRDHRYDPNMIRDRREIDNTGRGKRGRDSPLNNLDNLWPMKRENNERRYVKHQSHPFHSHKEPRTTSGSRFQRSTGLMRSDDRDRAYLDRRCDPNIPRDRREVEGLRRVKRRLDNPLNSSDNLLCTTTEDNDRRYIEHRPLPFHDVDGPRSCAHRRDINRESDGFRFYDSNISTFEGGEGPRFTEDHLVRRRHYKQFTNPFNANENIKSDHDLDSSFRRRHIQQPQVLHLDEELYEFRQQGVDVYPSEEPSYCSERFLRNKRPDGRHEHYRGAELIDEREVNRDGFKLIREEDFNNQFEGSPKFFRPDSPIHMHPRYRESVDPRLIVVGKKCAFQSSRRASEAKDVEYNGKYDLMKLNYQELKHVEDLNGFKPEVILADERKVASNRDAKNWHDKFPNNHNEFLDIEEGQIIEIDEKPLKCVIASEQQIDEMKNPETASNGNKVAEGLDDQKMREIIAKMEKRKARFKEPITLSRDFEKISTELNVESVDRKIVRPARKRRWCGS